MSADKWMLRAVLDTRKSGGDLLDPEDRWSNRSDEITELFSVKVVAQPMTDAELAEARKNSHSYDPLCAAVDDTDGQCAPGMPVHVVLVKYMDGDTFGNSYGNIKVMDIFTDPKDAASLADAIRKDADGRGYDRSGLVTDWQLPHNGREYYKTWVGYFERFEDVEIHTVLVQIDAGGSYYND